MGTSRASPAPLKQTSEEALEGTTPGHVRGERGACHPRAGPHQGDRHLLKGMEIETLRNIHQIVKDMAHG